MPLDEKNKLLFNIVKILLSFIGGAIITAYYSGSVISKMETIEHSEKTYLRKDIYESEKINNKEQLNRIEDLVKYLADKKQDKKGN